MGATSTRFLYLATLLAMGLLLLGLQAPTAFALDPGDGCMINAPSGATVAGDLALGHVGYAFLDPGPGTWWYGATENGGSSIYIPPGGDTETWIYSATSMDAMLADFTDGGPFHSVGYYTQYRCNNVSNSAAQAAIAKQSETAASGYNGLTDNCLTKSVAILNAYGEGLWYNGDAEGPNNYFNNLGLLSGWGPIIAL